MCRRLCPTTTQLFSTSYLGPFQSCREAQAPARSPRFVPWTRNSGATVPNYLPPGAELASTGSEISVQRSIKNLCFHVPVSSPRLSSHPPVSRFAQNSQFSIQKFGSNFCLTLEAAIPTHLRTMKPGTKSVGLTAPRHGWQGARCPRVGIASSNFPNTLEPWKHQSWPNVPLPFTLAFIWLQCTDTA